MHTTGGNQIRMPSKESTSSGVGPPTLSVGSTQTLNAGKTSADAWESQQIFPAGTPRKPCARSMLSRLQTTERPRFCISLRCFRKAGTILASMPTRSLENLHHIHNHWRAYSSKLMTRAHPRWHTNQHQSAVD
jgi:hypothetical protein